MKNCPGVRSHRHLTGDGVVRGIAKARSVNRARCFHTPLGDPVRRHVEHLGQTWLPAPCRAQPTWRIGLAMASLRLCCGPAPCQFGGCRCRLAPAGVPLQVGAALSSPPRRAEGRRREDGWRLMPSPPLARRARVCGGRAEPAVSRSGVFEDGQEVCRGSRPQFGRNRSQRSRTWTISGAITYAMSWGRL